MTAIDAAPFKLWLDERIAALNLPPIVAQVTLRSEASHRTFQRLTLQPQPAPFRTLIAMEAPPALERNHAFVTLARVFRDANIPVAQVLAYEPDQGWLLLTDLGLQDFEASYGTAEEAGAINAALTLLPTLQAVRSPAIERYSAERLRMELGIFDQWLVQATLKTALPAAVLNCFEALINAIDAQPKVCVHRDFHCRNLLWNNGQLGLVDFQDALHGPRCYDLASLLHDCYYQWPTDKLAHYRSTGQQLLAPDLSAAEFQRELEWTAIQRQLKATGIFLRLLHRDNRSTHLMHVLPTVSQTLALTQRYRELKALSTWLTTQAVALEQAVGKLKEQD